MSHVNSVTPPGPVTVAPGASVTLDVVVSAVPGDDSSSVRVAGSDGQALLVSIVTDRASLEGVLTGTPNANQVLGEVVTGPGNLTSVGAITGGWRYQFTAV